MAYDLQTVMEALRRADAAGNVEDARRLAEIADKLQKQPSGGMGFPMLPQRERAAEQTSPGIGAAFGRGLEQLISTGKTAVGATFGDPRAAMEESLKRREAIGAKYGESPGWEEVKKAYEERGLLSAAGEYVSQIPSALSEQAPQIATTMGAARLGSVGGAPGAIAGATIPSYTLAYGSLLEREAEEQRQRGEAVDPSRAKAAALAVPYAALDVAATFIPMGKGVIKSIFGDDVAKLLSRGATKEAEQLAAKKLSSEGFFKSLGVGTVKGVAVEVPTEIGQQALERLQAGLPLFDNSALAEYGQTAFEVSKLGPLGAVGRFSDKSGARQQVKTFEAEEAARKQQEATAAEEARKQTPDYLKKLHEDFTTLSTQEKELRDELKPYQGKKGKKALAALDEETRAAITEKFDALKEARAALSELGPEYSKRKPAINAMLEEARRAGMTPEEYFAELHGYKTEKEAEAAPEAEADSMQAWLDQTAAASEEGAKEIPTDFTSRLKERLGGLMWARDTGMLDDTSFRNGAVEAIMENPDMARRMVKTRRLVPGFSRTDSDTIIDSLKMQLEELPGKKVAAETEALQRMGDRTRPSEEDLQQMRIDEERYALRNIAQDESNPVGVNEKLNEIVALLAKQGQPAISSEVQRGEGAVESRMAGERVRDRAELVRLIEQFRLMQRQKGAARDDSAMVELLEKIRIAAQPVSEEVITEGETKAEENVVPLSPEMVDAIEAELKGTTEKSTYLNELNRLREEQDKAFPEALSGILEAEQYRRENPPTAQIQGPTAKAARAAIEAKETEATKRFVDAVLQEIEANRRAADLPSVTADEVKTITGRINNILREAATRKFGAPEQAQDVLREQIDEIRRDASVVERPKKQKVSEYEGRLRRQFNAPAPEGSLAERKEALVSRIEKAIDQLTLPKQDAAVLRDAARMLEEGAGSKELVADLEEQMYRYATGNMELLPEIAPQLKLDQSVLAEGEQTSLFTPGQQERADVRVMKQRRAALERRIEGRKGQKLTMEQWKEHQADVDALKQIEKEFLAIEAAGKKAPKATTPYGKEVAPGATAFTRSTSEEFIALVNKAREARETAAQKAAKANAEDKKNVADVKRAMDVLNAHITAMGARMQVLVNAVKQARRIAERAGRNSPGAKKIQQDIDNRLAEIAEEQKKVAGYSALVRQYTKQQEVSGEALVKIVDGLYKQRAELEKKIELLIVDNTVTTEAAEQATVKTETRKATKTGVEYEVTTQENAPPIWTFETGPNNKRRRVPKNPAAKGAIARYKKEIVELNREIAEIGGVFAKNIEDMASTIASYKSKISAIENFFVEAEPEYGIKGGTLDILEGTAETYLKAYINRNKPVQAALADATSFREVFDNLQQQRRNILSRLAGEKRAAEAIKAAEGKTSAERVAESQAEAQRQTGLGLPGVRVERSTITNQIEDAKIELEEANDELARIKTERDAAKGQQKAALTRQIKNTENRIIPELEAKLAELEEGKTKTAKQIFGAPAPKEAAPTKTAYEAMLDRLRGVTDKEERAAKSAATKARRATGRAQAAERTTEAKEEFEAGFDEFKLAREVSEARKPKAATKKLSPPQLRTGTSMTPAQRLKIIQRIAKNLAEGVASEREGGDREYFDHTIFKSINKATNPSTRASVLAELKSSFAPGTNIEGRVEIFDSVEDFLKDNPEFEGQIPDDAAGFVDNTKLYSDKVRTILIAKNIQKGQALAVLLHELGVHIGFRNFFSKKEFDSLVNVVKQWAKRNDGSIESRIGKAALQRVAEAKTPLAEQPDEILAYAVEEAINAGIDPTALKGGRPVTNWLNQLLKAFKAALKAFGLNPSTLTAQNFVDFAYGTASLELRGAWHGTDKNFTKFDTTKAGTGEGSYDTRFRTADGDTLGPGPYVTPDRSTGKYYSEAVPFGKAAITTGYGNRTYLDYRALDDSLNSIPFYEKTQEQHNLAEENSLLTAYLNGVGRGDSINTDNESVKKYIKNHLEGYKKSMEQAKGDKKVAYERAYNAVKALSVDKLIPLKEAPKPGTLYRTIDDIPDDKVYKVNSIIEPGVNARLDALVKKYGSLAVFKPPAKPGAVVKTQERMYANELFYAMRRKLGNDGAAKALEQAGFLAIERATERGRHVERAYLGVTPTIVAKNLQSIGPMPEGTVLFSRRVVEGDKAPKAVWETVNKVVKGPTGMMDRIRSEATGIGAQTAFIDRFAPLERVAEYMKKSSQAMQMMYYARMHDQRMAWTGETVNNGAPTLSKDEKGNHIITSRGGASMQDIASKLAEVKGYGNAEAVRNLFTTYLAAHRAKRVGAEKLNFSGSVTEAELARIREMGDNIPAFVKARELYNEYNNGLIDWLVQTGAMSKEVARDILRNQDYVPYYRTIGDNVVLEIAGVKPINIGNIQQQPYLRELVGGDQKIQDFFTSAVQNTSLLVDMGLRNLATKESAFALREAGLLEKLGDKDGKVKYFGAAKRRPAAPNVISWRDNGQEYYAIVNTESIGIPSELTVKGMHGTVATVGGLTKVMAVPARFLRSMITRSPLYAARQVFRDSLSNFMLAGGDMTPVASAARELGKMYAGKSEGEKLLQERGVIGGQLLTGTSEDMQKLLLQLTRGGVGWEMTLAKLDRMHMKADAAARITLYNDYRKQGLSDMEATLATLESMNFSKRGVSSSLYSLNMMVPFLNAQIQGLNVLYKAFSGKLPYAEKLQVQRKLITRGLMMAAGTMAYAAMMQDDEAYKNATLRDRLNNWFIKIPGLDEPIKVPIPFEVGIIFKALPEAVMMTASKDEDASKVLMALGGVIANASPVGMNTAMPQAVKPVIEAVANYNFFTGTGIESEYEQQLLPQERFRDKTSGVARGLSNVIGAITGAAGMPSKGVSPVMIDHLINGYSGGMGLAIAQMVGTLVPSGGATARAEKRLSDMPVVGSLFQPVDGAGQITQFYEKAKEYGEIKKTFDKLVGEGRADEASQLAKEYAVHMALSDVAEDFKQNMNEFTQLERTVRAANMSPKEKREQLDSLRQAKIEFAKAFNAASRQQ